MESHQFSSGRRNAKTPSQDGLINFKANLFLPNLAFLFVMPFVYIERRIDIPEACGLMNSLYSAFLILSPIQPPATHSVFPRCLVKTPFTSRCHF